MDQQRAVMFEWSPNGKAWFSVKLSKCTSKTSVDVICESYLQMGYQVRRLNMDS
ncbi:hypothetical protein [Vibrio sp. RE86]|uniref:hypothetical protein n=1 Tax=Vibrio sp. RE86 TaxID=2607605 RepID=UPI001493B769|nr:hypothetical protein [Vibrio sp. RE86]